MIHNSNVNEFILGKREFYDGHFIEKVQLTFFFNVENSHIQFVQYQQQVLHNLLHSAVLQVEEKL